MYEVVLKKVVGNRSKGHRSTRMAVACLLNCIHGEGAGNCYGAII
jgi:hypothetical protein